MEKYINYLLPITIAHKNISILSSQALVAQGTRRIDNPIELKSVTLANQSTYKL